MAADRILGLERSKRGRNIRAREEVEHGGGWGTHCGRGTHCGQPLEGRGDTAEEAILPLATHSIHKALINRVTLARPGAKHASAWAGGRTADSPAQGSCGTAGSAAAQRWLPRAAGPGTGSAWGAGAGCHSSRSYSFPCTYNALSIDRCE